MPANSTIASIFEKVKDSITGFVTQITGDHRYIHEGKAFTYIGTTGSLAAGSGTYSVSIHTPTVLSGKKIHFRPAKLSSTANTMLLTVTEGSTTTGGTAATPINRNRNSSAVSQSVVKAGITVSVAGTTIHSEAVGGGSNPSNSVGGAGGANEELVLLPDTEYAIKIDNIGATTASTGYFELFWYEE